MEITLQAQWKEAEPTETPEPRDTGTYRDAGTHDRPIPRRSRAAQESRIRKRHGNGRQRGYRDGSPLAAIRAALGLGAAAAAVLMAYRRRAKPLKQNKL